MADGRGYIIPVGGAEEKIGDVTILRRFAALCGTTGRIAIIPTASELSDTGQPATRRCSASSASAAGPGPADPRPARDAELPELLEILDAGRRHLPHRRQPAPAEHDDRRHARWPRRSAGGTRRACTSAGTSAGAAFLCEHMIAFGEEGASPRARIVTLAPGLGLTNRVDHRPALPPARPAGPAADGAGLQPVRRSGSGSTRTRRRFIGPDETLEVVGGGALTIVDPSELEFSSMARVRKNDPVCLIGLRLAHPRSRLDVQPAYPRWRPRRR